MDDYKTTQLHYLKTSIKNYSTDYNDAMNECFKINKIVTATEHSIEMVNSIDLMLLNRIEKCIQEYNGSIAGTEEQVTLLKEKELNKLSDEFEINTNIGGYQAKADGNIHQPMSCTNKYEITSFDRDFINMFNKDNNIQESGQYAHSNEKDG